MDKLVEYDIRKSQYLTNKCAEYLKRSGFSIIHRKEEGEGLSGYTIYCEKNTTDTIFVVRVSNHIAVLENFAKHYPAPLIAKPKLARRMGKNVQPRYKKQVFRSFVFKDFDIPENNTTSRKIVCPEYVFSPDNIYDNGLIDTVTNGISQSISLPDGQQPQICSVTPNIRIGRKQQLEENKQTTNINKNMKKQTIKLNESQLRNIIKESVNQILNEENEETFESVVFKKAFDIRAWVRDIQHAMSGLEQCARQMDAKEGATAHYLTQVVNGVRFSLEQIENDTIELKNARADVIRQQK